MSKPHDALFKATFRDPVRVGPILGQLLPAQTVEQIDWPTLELEHCSGVDGALRDLHADLVFSVQLRSRNETVYFVLEHKSTADYRTPRQLFRYVDLNFGHFFDSATNRLPQIVCCVVYHGKSHWRRGTNLLASTAVSANLWPDPVQILPSLPFLLLDLTRTDADSLRASDQSAIAKLTLFALKRARPSDDFLRELHPWIDELRTATEEQNPSEAHYALFEYMMKVTDLTYPRILEFLSAEVGQPATKLMKSAYDQILEEGEARGEARGMAKILLTLIERRFGPVPSDDAHRIRHSSPEDLARWAERVLTAESLQQVFVQD